MKSIYLYFLFLSFAFPAYPSQLIDSLQQELQQSQSLEEKIDIYNHLAHLLATEQPILALQYINTALEQLGGDVNSKASAKACHIKGNILHHLGKDEAARTYLEKAYGIHEILGDSISLVNINLELGKTARRVGKKEQASAYYKEAICISSKIDYPRGLASAYSYLGYLYKQNARYVEALKYLFQSLELTEKFGTEKELAARYSVIGEIYDYYAGAYDLAEEYHFKAMNLRKKLKDSRGRCISLRNLGAMERRRDNYNKSKEYLTEGLELSEVISYTTLKASLFYELAYLYYDNGDYEAAIYALEQSLAIHQRSNNFIGQLLGEVLFGNIYFELKDYQKALTFGKSAFEKAEQNKMIEATELPSELLARCYNATNDFRKAYEYQLTYQKAKEITWNKTDITKAITENLLYTYKVEKEELQKKQQQEEEMNQLLQQRKVLIVSFFAALLLILLTWIIYWDKKKANKNLTAKNEELIAARRNAEEAANAKQNFLTAMSHEIRTPMNAVIGFTKLLLEERPNENQITYLQNLKLSSKQLLGLLNDILEYSKIESKKLQLHKSDFDVVELIENIARTYGEAIQNPNLDIKVEIKKDQIQRFLHGDSLRLSQVLINLVSNATKFTPAGTVWIRAWTEHTTEDQVLLYVEVEDTGIGISKEDQAVIFDSFTQRNELDSNHRGAGLGLTIAKELLELQDGGIAVESELGKGSKFIFYVPYIAIDTINTEQPTRQLVNNYQLYSGIRALIVEDNLFNQKILAAILKKWGMEIVTTTNGEQAMEVVQTQKLDLILMDIFLPEMDGFTVAQQIRSIPNINTDVPIVAVTASMLDEIDEQAKLVGINYKIGKPFNKEQLKGVIEQALQQRADPILA